MIRRIFWLFVVLLSGVLLSGSSSPPPSDPVERVRVFTRPIEFDYVAWTLNALGVKLGQVALRTDDYIPKNAQSALVLQYLDLVRDINTTQRQIQQIYGDANISDKEKASAELSAALRNLEDQRTKLEPLAESILQSQISSTVNDLGLAFAGQAMPPTLYRTTPPPDALIVSPRDIIRQDADLSIKPGLTIEQITTLEENVDTAFNVSSLVVGIGGIGVYPTMVMQTTDINWLSEVVAHEWVHNFLTLRPLGLSYLSSPELRIMNETAASIAGKEIGRAVVEHYYPAQLPPPAPSEESVESEPAPGGPPPFDFRREMHETRVSVDRLLSEGRIAEAEDYMENRRRLFWESGYPIRKLNQAYFAFYGAYADMPIGAAGKDPVGEAVRTLRAQGPNLAAFLKRISWMWSFNQLQKITSKGQN